VLEVATTAILSEGEWKGWEVVRRPTGQVIGYRKLREGDWFIRNDETRAVEGPFATKRLCLATVRERSGTKVGTGVYKAGNYTLFTRAQQDAVLGKEGN